MLDIFLISIALATDSFSVCIPGGIVTKKIGRARVVEIALIFGLFQGGMLCLGWLLGEFFKVYIMAFDHWIAFGLLFFLGAKTIHSTISKKEEDAEFTFKKMHHVVFMAIATSIDALAVGISIITINVPIVISSLMVGGVTFVLSLVGLLLGERFAKIFHKKFEDRVVIAGGVMLILIGFKILYEHMK
jgi:putative Mn2+ efflux pump MntP